MAITRDSSIAETIRSHPRTVAVFRKWKMECPGCLGAETESIEHGALMHGLDPEEIIRELNRVVKENRR